MTLKLAPPQTSASAISQHSPIPDARINTETHHICVTDSGPGGLTTMAALDQRMRREGSPWPRTKITFFNSLPRNAEGQIGYGYQGRSPESRAALFDRALRGMQRLVNPDELLIACNTLSAVAEHTRFAQQSPFPIHGIVNTSVDMMDEFLRNHPEARLIVFATNAITNGDIYPSRLILRGHDRERILGQTGGKLNLDIEYEGAESPVTRETIRQSVAAAIEKLGGKDSAGPIGISLNCTHYPFVETVFREELARLGITPIGILSPNARMTDIVFAGAKKLYPGASIELDVITNEGAEFPPEQINSLGRLLEMVSPEVAEAYRNNRVVPNLFEWRDIPS